jgi:hypothetical protein
MNPANTHQSLGGAASTIARLHSAAEKGDASAQFRLGLAYAKGSGVEPDGQQALHWWRSAAKLCGKRSRCQILPPVDFRCRDGHRFTIVFLTHREAAYLFLSGDSVEQLMNDRLASGIGYTGNEHSFEQHKSRVTLATLSGHRTKLTACRPIAPIDAKIKR